MDGLITDAGKVCAEQAQRERLVRLRDPEGAVPRRGQEDDGLRAGRADGLEAARRHPLPHRRRHRPHRDVEGVRRRWRPWASSGPSRPRMYAVQAEGCAPIVKAFAEGREEAPMWEDAADPRPRPARAQGHRRLPHPARAAREPRRRRSPSRTTEIIQGVKDAAATEGLFMAPEGGACVAALRKLKASGHLSADDVVVVVQHRHRLQVRRQHGRRSGDGVPLLYRDDPVPPRVRRDRRRRGAARRAAGAWSSTAPRSTRRAAASPGTPGPLGGARGGRRSMTTATTRGARPRPPSSADDTVRGRVDAARRRDHMQQHHGQHLLSRAVVEVAGGAHHQLPPRGERSRRSTSTGS